MVAKATGGQFLLRIEDTDQVTSVSLLSRAKLIRHKKRTVHDAEERLYKDLEWAGIEWDEGRNHVMQLRTFTDSFRAKHWGSLWAI